MLVAILFKATHHMHMRLMAPLSTTMNRWCCLFYFRGSHKSPRDLNRLLSLEARQQNSGLAGELGLVFQYPAPLFDLYNGYAKTQQTRLLTARRSQADHGRRCFHLVFFVLACLLE
jgi:hypothetical protein